MEVSIENERRHIDRELVRKERILLDRAFLAAQVKKYGYDPKDPMMRFAVALSLNLRRTPSL